MGSRGINQPLSVPPHGGANFRSKVPAPVLTPAMLTPSAGGVLAQTTYGVQITYVNAAGETIGSGEQTLLVAANNVLNVASPAAQGSVIQGNEPATGWNVYVTNTPGNNWQKQNAAPIAIGTPWVEPVGGLIGGALLPTVDTSAFGGAKQVTNF